MLGLTYPEICCCLISIPASIGCLLLKCRFNIPYPYPPVYLYITQQFTNYIIPFWTNIKSFRFHEVVSNVECKLLLCLLCCCWAQSYAVVASSIDESHLCHNLGYLLMSAYLRYLSMHSTWFRRSRGFLLRHHSRNN